MRIAERASIFLFPLLPFLLPWQTALVIKDGSLPGLMGAWQYGTIQLYGLDLFIIALLIFAACALGKKGLLAAFLRRESMYALLCAAAAVVAVGFAADRALALLGAIRLLEAVGIYVALRSLPVSVSSIAAWWIAAGCIQSILAIVQFSVQEAGAHAWLGMAYHSPQVLGDAVVENAGFRWLRAYGSFPHPNVLALYLAFGLVFVFWRVGRVEERWKTYGLIACAGLMTTGLFFTFSRDGWIALALAALAAAGALLAAGRRIRSDGRFSPTVVCVLACTLTAVLLSWTWWEPLSVRLGFAPANRLENKSVQERTEGVREALALVPLHMEGAGMGNYTSVLADEKKNESRRFASEYQPVHVMPLVALVETGLLGFVGLLGFIVAAVRACFSLPRPVPLSVVILAVLLVPLFFDHFYWTLFPGMLMWWSGWALFYKRGT